MKRVNVQEKALKTECRNIAEECTILGGIDTLYFFVDTNFSLASTKLYQNIWDSVNNHTFEQDCYKFLNFSGKKNGFVGAWYDYTNSQKHPLFKVGFKDPTKQKQVNNIYVQLLGTGIYSLGFSNLMEEVKKQLSLLLGTPISNDNLFPSRVDLNVFVNNFDFSKLEYDMFRTNFPKPDIRRYNQEWIGVDFNYSHIIGKMNALETMYLGVPSAPLRLRIYDKRLELSVHSNKLQSLLKKSFLDSNGMTSEHLWQIEFQIRREILKAFEVNTMSDLLVKADSIFKYLMQKNAFLGFCVDNIDKFRTTKNLHRLPISPIWQYIIDNYKFCNYTVDVKRIYKQYREGSHYYSSGVILRELKRQIEFNQGFTIDELMALFNEAQKVY